MIPAAIELGLGPVVSKAISSDFLEGDTGTVGLEDEVEPAGMENPITEDVGRALRGTGPEDGAAGDEEEEEVGVRRRSAHDFLAVAGTTSGTSWGGAGEGVEVGSEATTLEEVTEEDSTSSAGGRFETSSSSSAVSIVVSWVMTSDSSITTGRMVVDWDGELGWDGGGVLRSKACWTTSGGGRARGEIMILGAWAGSWGRRDQIAHFAIGLTTGSDVCDVDWGEDCGETTVTVSDVEMVPIWEYVDVWGACESTGVPSTGVPGGGSEAGSRGNGGLEVGVEGAGGSDLISFSEDGTTDGTGLCEDWDSPGGEAKEGSWKAWIFWGGGIDSCFGRGEIGCWDCQDGVKTGAVGDG
jgi:hypothetical protein